MERIYIDKEVDNIIKWYMEDEKRIILHDVSLKQIGFDSLDRLQIMTHLERNFNIFLPDDLISKSKPISEICDYIEQNSQHEARLIPIYVF